MNQFTPNLKVALKTLAASFSLSVLIGAILSLNYLKKSL
jgi:hypothetical protein